MIINSYPLHTYINTEQTPSVLLYTIEIYSNVSHFRNIVLKYQYEKAGRRRGSVRTL